MFIKNGYDAVKLTAPNPATLLELLNDNIAQTYRTAEMLFTAACLDLEIATGKVTVACAANPPSCIVRKDGITMFEGGGALMGLRPRMRYTSTTSHLEPGDGIYLFTDGIADTHSEKGELFGEDRLFATIRASHAEAGRAADAVRTAIKSFCGSRGLTDDATMIGLVLSSDDEDDPLTVRR
jgi:sigma-B regulation protein RsbU (phosphoserine phosphatase)